MRLSALIASNLRSTRTSRAGAQVDTIQALAMSFDRGLPSSMEGHLELGEVLWEVGDKVK